MGLCYALFCIVLLQGVVGMSLKCLSTVVLAIHYIVPIYVKYFFF